MGTKKAPAGFPLPIINSQARQEEFGYTCNRCMNCCRNMDVPVDPYEAARLARHLGISTTLFRSQYTRDSVGNRLTQQADGACIFLGEAGCTAYSDRPLACRLYPLCREITPDDQEIFTHLAPKPMSAGVYCRGGTIEDFLDSQGVAPYIQASDEYYAWYCLAVEALEGNDGELPATGGEEPSGGDVSFGLDLLDMDLAVAAYCAKKQIPEPRDLEERKTIHLLTLHDAIKPD